MRRRVSWSRRTASLLLLATLPATADELPATELEPLIVTAQKQPQDERSVPASVAVIDGHGFDSGLLRNVDDLSREAANTQFTKNQLFIRGFGTSSTFGFEPSVALFVDGVHVARATAATMPYWDLERIEILRGPQGTVLGKNSVAGALSLSTADPGGAPAARATAALGDFDPYRLRAAADIDLGERAALRLSGLAERGGGYVFNTTLGEEGLGTRTRGLRAKGLWLPTPDWTARLAMEWSAAGIDGLDRQLSRATPATLALYRLYDPRTEAALDARSAYDTPQTGGERKGRSATLNLIRAGANLRLTWIGNVLDSDFAYLQDADYSAVPLIALGIDERYRQWSQELRWLLQPAPSFEILAGVHVQGSALSVDTRIDALPQGSAGLAAGLAGLPAPLAAALLELGAASGAADAIADRSDKAFRQQALSGALFGELGWQFAERWRLNTGLRWTQERKRVHMLQQFRNSGLLFRQFLGEQPYEARDRRRERDLSPRLTLQYTMTPDVVAYALAAQGHKGGGYNDIAPRPEVLEFGDERARTLEGGFKGLFAGRRLALNLGLFRTRFDDLQVVSYDGTSFYVRNAAAARALGAELDLRARLSAGWSLRGSIGYLDARYRSFADAPSRADQQAESQDLGGARLPAAPYRSASIGIDYVSSPLAGRLQWRAGAGAQYRSHSYLNLDNDPIDAQPTVTLWNARLALQAVDGRWSLALSGLNLGDTLSRNAASDVPLFAGNHWAEPDPPRRLLATLEWTP